MKCQLLLYTLISLILSACSLDTLYDIAIAETTPSAPVTSAQPITPPPTSQTYAEGDDCYAPASFLPPHGIIASEQAVVRAAGAAIFTTENAAVWLRADHASDSRLSRLEAGALVSVLSGPYCFATRNAHSRWWRVRVESDGTIGYVDEYENRLGVLNIYLEPVAASNQPLTIHYFAVSIPDAFGRPARPGETVYLSWDVAGAAEVSVTQQNNGDIVGEGLRNAVAFVAPPNTPTVNFTLLASAPDGTRIEQARTLHIECSACDEAQTTQVQLAYQPFEGGFMLYHTAARRIYVLHNNGTAQVFDDTWQGETFAIEGTPPEGQYQPQFGFGKVWATEVGVRDQLGWATDGESYYESTMTISQSGAIELQTLGGRFIVVAAGTWRFRS